MLRGLRARLIVVCLACLPVLALPPALLAAPGLPHTKLPRGLVVLERRMSTLRINSVRGTITESTSGVSLGSAGSLMEALEGGQPSGKNKHAAASAAVTKLPVAVPLNLPLLTADFEVSVSPRLAAIRGELFGGLPVQFRLIGEDEYTFMPIFALIPGSKSWISTTAAERSAEESRNGGKHSAELPTLGEAMTGSRKLIALLAKARSVVEVGPANVDGQRTTEFKATLGLSVPVGASKPPAHRRRRHAEETLHLYLAPDGLAVRTQAMVQMGTERVADSTDILATEVPVSVVPPPAGETISQTELNKRQEAGSGLSQPLHLTKRQQAEGRRMSRCMRKRLAKQPTRGRRHAVRKDLRECERIAKRAK